MTRIFPIRWWSDLTTNSLDEFDSIFDALVGTRVISRDSSHTVPRANVQQLEEGYVIKLAAPGFSKSDFKIHTDAECLTISAKSETAESDSQFSSREYAYDEFTRSWKLPTSVNAADLTARYESGILSVMLPTHKKKSDRFEIKVE
jgi:HSP20 family protein